jgi:hypothetical protein
MPRGIPKHPQRGSVRAGPARISADGAAYRAQIANRAGGPPRGHYQAIIDILGGYCFGFPSSSTKAIACPRFHISSRSFTNSSMHPKQMVPNLPMMNPPPCAGLGLPG